MVAMWGRRRKVVSYAAVERETQEHLEESNGHLLRKRASLPKSDLKFNKYAELLQGITLRVRV